jgi:hypothetical protein
MEEKKIVQKTSKKGRKKSWQEGRKERTEGTE